MASFLHTADLHLGQAGGEALPEEIARQRQLEITESLSRIVDLALEKEVDLLLVAGDLFTDKFASPALLRFADHQFSRLGKVKVLVSAGNHDPLLPGSPWEAFSWQENVRFFPPLRWEQLSFPELGVAVTGLSWGKGRPGPELFAEMPPAAAGLANIALLHGSAGQAASLAADYFPLPAERIADLGYRYVALGHYHAPASWREGNAVIAYPGSPEALSFAEEGSHGVWLGNTAPEKLEFIPVGSRQYVTLRRELAGADSEDRLVAELAEALQGRRRDFVRLLLTGALPAGFSLDLDYIAQRLREEVHFLKLVDETREEPAEDFRPGSLRQLFYQQIASELAATSDPDKRKMLNLALKYGLTALATGSVQVGKER